jgi:cytochrome c556
MTRKLCAASATALIMAAVVVPAIGRDGETPSIKDVMGKLNKGNNAPLAQLKTALKAQKPDWKGIQESSKLYAELAPAMPKNDPPRGDSAAYKKLAETFATNSKDLDDAAKKEDLAATKAAFGKISGSCMSCHRAHRGPAR